MPRRRIRIGLVKISASYFLETLEAYVDGVNAAIAAAQEPDGNVEIAIDRSTPAACRHGAGNMVK